MAKKQAEEYLAVLKKRLYIKRLPTSYNILDHSIDNIERMVQKMIAQFKYDLILLEISTNEHIARSHTNMIAYEKKKLTDSAGDQNPLPKSLVSILNAISTRQSNIIKRAELITKHKVSFFDEAPVKPSHIRLSTPIIEVTPFSSFNCIEFLANGPPFIPICQSHFSNVPIDIRIVKERETLVNSFKNGLHVNCVSASDQRANEFFAAIKDLFYQSYTKPLSPELFARARYEQKMIETIKHIRNKHNIIIQRSDKSKVFHLASAISYHDKSVAYMAKTQAYQEIENGINPCKDYFDRILALLKPLLKNKAINLNIWKQSMHPTIETIELPHLYFIPKPHKIGTPLRPIISMIRSPAKGISHFLDLVLRPIFQQATRQTSFINDIHFIRRLELYRNLGLLTPKTNFITFDVTDLYTMIPRNRALVALEQFLKRHAINGRINGMTIDTLIKLSVTVLETNSFVFEGKYYKQIRGGAMGSPFTMTLANISHNELYGRYIDDVFMTSNLSLDKINFMLDVVNNQDENIRITRSIGLNAQFLDVSVYNNQGQLKTTVFHKPSAAPYILPFLFDHPRHIHRSIIKAALLRAVRLCSHVQDFNQERLRIEITLLLNDYPPKFIAYHFKTFFQQNNVALLLEQLDDAIYQGFHQKQISLPTQHERERQQGQPTNSDRTKQSPNQTEQRREQWNSKEIRVHYIYSSGPMSEFKQRLKQLWKNHYVHPGSPLNNVALKIGTRSNKSLQHILVKNKPLKSMLIDINTTNT
ncbi:unnamed protein product [Adineta ricciae]|uniref:Reverse transcriptase domain-containing protein n=1 Tax=Adineta ricciae TaxID=249248 RepID=A0A814BJ66_ADIRI|nr:unnamed protein product [Adineta ricciae]